MADTPAFSLQELTSAEVETRPNADQRSRTADLIRSAFLLNGSTAVEVTTRTFLSEGNRLFTPAGMRLASFSRGSPPQTIKFPADRVLETYDQLSNFGEPEPLLRVIDRLGRSRLNVFPADKALDLGIGAEILLMHGSSQANTEITHKMSMRTAWMLGTNLEERLAIAKEAKNLYRARSQVAHWGALREPAKFDIANADKLVGDLIREVLNKGKFPNWEALCLGG